MLKWPFQRIQNNDDNKGREGEAATLVEWGCNQQRHQKNTHILGEHGREACVSSAIRIADRKTWERG